MTAKEVLGFSTIEAANCSISDFTAALNAAAKGRGIALNVPSDALDLSLDVILLEATASIGVNYAIADDAIRIWPTVYGDKWPVAEESAR